MALLNKLGTDKFVALYNSDAQISKWLSTERNINNHLAAYFAKMPSFADVKNHLSLITTVLHNSEAVSSTKAQTKTLTNTLLEYAINEAYTFRGEPVYRVFEAIAKRGDAGFELLEALLVKQSEIIDKSLITATVDEDGKK